jgi:TrmH family RNA methyltransferase
MSDMLDYSEQQTVITSSSNQDIKRLRSLHERKYRKQTGWFLAEGLRICTEALQQGFAPQRLLYEDGRQTDPLIADLIIACKKAGGRVLPVTRSLLVKVSNKDNPQTVIGAYQKFSTNISEIKTADVRCWVALDRIRDPGNLGTIIRTIDAVAADGVILIDDCTDPFSVESVRASMGAIFTLKVSHCTSEEFITFKQEFKGSVIGTALQSSVDYRTADWRAPCIILMGNEQAGLPIKLRQACDQIIAMPMQGRSDSLNLAVATGISLYEFFRNQSD